MYKEILKKWPEYSSGSSYSFEKTLGKGAFGKVKQAVHKYTKEKVAIKIVKKSKFLNSNDQIRVHKEISILRTLKSPYIIKLLEVIESPSEIWLVFEYLPDGELYEYIKDQARLSESESLLFFQQLVLGIEYLHSKDVVHRDIKPENLLLQKKHLKIADFGLSNKCAEGELLSTACGSPCFAAPEILIGHKYSGKTADIWSCGIVLFSLLCGFLPFEEQNTSLLYKKIIKGEFKIPSFVNAHAKDLILQILEVDPQKRINIDGIKKHLWFCSKRLEIRTISTIFDKEIAAKLEKVGFQKKNIEEVWQKNIIGHVMTCYYLLFNKKKIFSKQFASFSEKRILLRKKSNLSLNYSIINKYPNVDMKKSNSANKNRIRSANSRENESLNSIKERSVGSNKMRPTIYKGIYDIRCLTMENPPKIIEKTKQMLMKANIEFLQNSFRFTCKTKNKAFTINLYKIEGDLQIYLICVSENCSDAIYSKIVEICSS